MYSRGLDAVPVFSRTLKVMLTDLSIVPLVIIAHTLPTEPSSTVHCKDWRWEEPWKKRLLTNHNYLSPHSAGGRFLL